MNEQFRTPGGGKRTSNDTGRGTRGRVLLLLALAVALLLAIIYVPDVISNLWDVISDVLSEHTGT
ncbi:hypothetical protein [Kibdelosporangium aridum]|nr:hypothetical protein [Kibdelosporangium aridum]